MNLLQFEEVRALRAHLDRLRAEGMKVGVVPTMGALHAGHLSLVREVKARTDVAVVTIFVNPTQFGPNEDFDRYPRDIESDRRLVAAEGADIIFAPSTIEMYPAGEQTRISVAQISEGLCGAHRPGHFVGVATVVAKLFNAVGPGTYVFGQKDYQQLKVIQRMAEDLLFPVDIVAAPIVRDDNGLALSSRNAYLSSIEKRVALGLSAGLFLARSAYQGGERTAAVLLRVATCAIEEAAEKGATLELEYLELRHADSLSSDVLDEYGKIAPGVHALVLLVAARLGGTRLIDNIVLAD